MKEIEVRVYIGYKGDHTYQDKEHFFIDEPKDVYEAITQIAEYVAVTHENLTDGSGEEDDGSN